MFAISRESYTGSLEVCLNLSDHCGGFAMQFAGDVEAEGKSDNDASVTRLLHDDNQRSKITDD